MTDDERHVHKLPEGVRGHLQPCSTANMKRSMSLSLALFQPDIPQNLGSMIRLCACLGLTLDIIEPCGFPLDDTRIRRAAMDYIDKLTLTRHVDWEHFQSATPSRRKVLLSTKASQPYTSFTFQPDDILLLGRESAGVPESVHKAADARVFIPMQPGCRSLNIALSAAIVAAEALRQSSASE